MKSIERVFNKIKKRNPVWSSYLSFAEAIKGRNFSPKTIRYHFNRLVKKDDYSPKEKREILKFLYKLTLPLFFQALFL